MKNNPNKLSQEITITGEGWLYVVILAFISVGAVLRNVNLLILMSGMMIAPLIINWRLAVVRARTLTAKRSLPYRVHAKSVSGIQWLCFNHSALSAWGIEVVDSLSIEKLASHSANRVQSSHAADVGPSQWPLVGDAGEDESVSDQFIKRVFQSLKEAAGFDSKPKAAYNLRLTLPTVAGNQQEVITSRVYFSQRGVYRFGPAKLVTRFPFGLVSLTIFNERFELLYVAPEIGKLTPVWDRRVRSILAGSEALLKRRGLAGDDFYALRRWRSGDSRKLIHWRSSAKYGYPIVKQFEQPDNRDFALLLDLWNPSEISNSGSAGVDSLDSAEFACETCLSFAATVILNISSAVKGRIGLAVCGQETTLLQSRSQRELIEGAMRSMAVARSTSNPELISGLIRLADTVSTNTPLVVISSRPQVDWLAANSAALAPQYKGLQNVWSSVVWLHTGSPEFRDLFQLEGQNQDLQALATKWSAHVSN